MKDSRIEWTDHTFNPWIGCTKVSPGCANCYAEALMDTRYGRAKWGPGNPRHRTSAENWREPLKWNRDAAKANAVAYGSTPIPPIRPRVFCASLADWLDEEVPDLWLADLLRLIFETRSLTWMLLTKRPQNWKARLQAAGKAAYVTGNCTVDFGFWLQNWITGRAVPDNVWIGTSVEDQERADERIPALLDIPARIRFLSCEPLLGSITLTECAPYIMDGDTSNPGVINAFNALCHHPKTCISIPDAKASSQGINWVICGGESGPHARPMLLDWARSLRDQCQAAGCAFFFKQGSNANWQDFKNFESFPAELQIRQFPEIAHA